MTPLIRGDRIHDLRIAHDMTLEVLGRKIGVSKATIKRYENGIIANIPSDKIEALAEALETTPEYLMGWTEGEEETSIQSTTIQVQHPETRILAKGFDQMPEEARKRALSMARMIFVEYADLFDEKGATHHDP